MAFRKYLKLSIKEEKKAFQVQVGMSTGKTMVLKSFASYEAAEAYKVKFIQEGE